MSTADGLLKSARDRARAEAEAASCPHRPACPGCPRFGEPGLAPTAHAALAALAAQHGLPRVPLLSGAQRGFRHRARLAIRGRLGAPKIGLFELGTHRVVHIPNCSVQHPLINRVASVVRKALVDARLTAYSDAAQLGLARYLQVVVERSSQRAQVVLVGNSADPSPFTSCFELIRERLGSDLHSLWWNGNTAPQNTILGAEFRRLYGPESVIEHFGGNAIHYPPGAFGQNNLEVFGQIVDHVRAEIPEGARVSEFYAGVGAIGLSVLARVAELRLNEIGKASLRGLELGLEQLAPSERTKISLHPGSAGDACAAALGVDVVVADPPRKGLDPALSDFLIEHPPPRFIYVSCGLSSLLDDVKRLTAQGSLRLCALSAFNQMPFTDHVETVACFARG